MSDCKEIRCDQCNRDLTTTGNSVDYRVLLKAEQIPSRDGALTDAMDWPYPKTPKRFCGPKCVWAWMNDNA